VPASVSPHDRRPIRAETRATLVASIARGRRRLEEIVGGTGAGGEQMAARDKRGRRRGNVKLGIALRAGVPGAYRMLANMISYGQAK